jgi:ABC-type lipoprotein export system ATPase subunit
VMVTHNLQIAARCDRAMVLQDGGLVPVDTAKVADAGVLLPFSTTRVE